MRANGARADTRGRGSPSPARACCALGTHAALREVPPFLWDQPARRWQARSVSCPLFVLAQGSPPSWSGMPCAGSACCHTGGSPPLPCAVCRNDPPSSPSCPRAVCARCSDGGSPSSSWSPSVGGVLMWSAWGLPPLPPMRASGVHCWAGGSPPPSLPPRPLALGAGCSSGGPSSPLALAGSPALQELAGGHPLVQGVPLAGGSPSTDTQYGS